MTEDCSRPTWQQAMKLAIRDATALCTALSLESNQIPLSAEGEREFPVFVPLEFLERMEAGNPRDPLLLQVLPRQQESYHEIGFTSDPVGDSAVEVAPGLLHKYDGRVLLILSGACAVHCRYCFRRHYPYGNAPKSPEKWLPALEYIRQDTTIHEVILSGGDPLTQADVQLAQLVERLDAIPHLTRLRIHTRLPVVIPQRVDGPMIDWLTKTRLAKWVVLHINHRQEVSESLVAAIGAMQKTGAVVLNQSVLLHGVNDSTDCLVELSEALINIGVMPYYLHQLDKVAGASHFEVDAARGIEIISQMSTRLPGFGVPKYVAEIAGEPSKTNLQYQANRAIEYSS